ncbi:MAG: NADH-quinone oxidoreductase subunit C [Candidatus Marsarchaeota archaeon]|nr:NADH-quinone oxidoreductase subunit C [Candidatus Marsarchaeota archaeon]
MLEEYKKKGFDYLKKVLAVDYLSYLELVYIIYNTESKEQALVTVKLSDTASPLVDSITRIYPSSDWHEREIHEMFGIRFKGRKNMERLLLLEWNSEKFPLRKSFEWGAEYRKKE